MNVTREDVLTALDDAGSRFVELVRSLDAESAALPAIGSWTAADTAAHMLTVVRRALGDMRRSRSAAETATLNQLCLDEVDERDPKKLADSLDEDRRKANDVLASIPEDLEFPFHAGLTTTIVPACCVVLGEFEIHGYDIATATGRPWSIPARHAVMFITGGASLLGGWVREDAAPESFEIRLPDAEPLVLRIRPGGVDVERRAGADVDHVIDVDPVDFVLEFPTRRKKSGDPTVAKLTELFEPV